MFKSKPKNRFWSGAKLLGKTYMGVLDSRYKVYIDPNAPNAQTNSKKI